MKDGKGGLNAPYIPTWFAIPFSLSWTAPYPYLDM